MFELLILLFSTNIISYYSVNGQETVSLFIIHNGNKQLNNSHIVKLENDKLDLLCENRMDFENKSSPKLYWRLPTTTNRPSDLPMSYQINYNGSNSRLIVDNLQESDSGRYWCVLSEKETNLTILMTSINLVLRRPAACTKGVFCGSRCINERYVCDGLSDCPNGKDESLMNCGPNPCQDKIRCPDGRCIPQSLCCNFSVNTCKTKWKPSPCCPGSIINEYGGSLQDFDRFREYNSGRSLNYLNNPEQYTDLSFLQTTVYAVFGCAILFMLIVTILVVVMQCKLQMRKNRQTNFLNRQRIVGNRTYRGALNQEFMDMVMERFNRENHNSNPQQPNGLQVMYNFNNGLQFIGKPIEPPPYSEVATNPPRDQGPPPPYVVLTNLDKDEDVHQPLVENSQRNETEGEEGQASENVSSENAPNT